MKTQVLMKRQLFGFDVTQQSQTAFLSATDLVKAGNHWRMKNHLTQFNDKAWFKNNEVKEFISSLEEQFGQVKISGRGRGHHTWVHPLLFIDLALAISPKLKIEVYTWMYDYLLQYRNDSGDSYKRMCGAIYLRISNKSEFKDCIINTANRIKEACNVSDWQCATQEQLRLRDIIHNNISLLSDVLTNTENAIRIGIVKSIEQVSNP